MTRCTVGVLAHNEAQNVQRTLHALLSQQLQHVTIEEIIVVASGCTDSTVALAEGIATAYPIVSVDVETHRTGKASAIRRLMSIARGDIIVLVGADTVPESNAIESLVAPFSDPAVGMTGARIIPLNAPTTWLGFTVQMLWHVHHQLALRKPKLGELVAFRNVIDDFPDDTSTDEPALEALIAAKGLRLVYTPQAVVYNRGPERMREFVVQRRRIFAGQVRIALRYGYFTSSLRFRHVLPLTVEAIRTYPRFSLWTFAAMGVECWARVLGLYDGLGGHDDVVWHPARSTKDMTSASEPVSLISVRWAPGSLDSNTLLRSLRRESQPTGPVFFWSDDRRGEILLFVSGESPLEWVQHRIDRVSRGLDAPQPAYANSLLSCRLVTLPSSSLPN